MREIDASVISRDELLGRINRSVAERGVPEEIKEGYYGEDFMDQSGKDYLQTQLDSLLNNIRVMDQTWYLYDTPLTCNRRFLGKPLTFLRKVLRWFMKPYLSRMSNFNGAAVRAISDIAKIEQALLAEVRSEKGNKVE